MQLYGAILLWKTHLRQQEDAICMTLLRKYSYWRRNWKKARQRYLRPKKRSCWHKPGRTDFLVTKHIEWNITRGVMQEKFSHVKGGFYGTGHRIKALHIT